jgi:hypothetical protein
LPSGKIIFSTGIGKFPLAIIQFLQQLSNSRWKLYISRRELSISRGCNIISNGKNIFPVGKTKFQGGNESFLTGNFTLFIDFEWSVRQRKESLGQAMQDLRDKVEHRRTTVVGRT